MLGRPVPDVVFNPRVRDERVGGDTPSRRKDLASSDAFEDRRIVLLALPGAFTPI